MNSVDFLLIISKRDVGKSRNYSRNFNSSVYDRFEWLCGCPKRNKLFCFICLVMGGQPKCMDSRRGKRESPIRAKFVLGNRIPQLRVQQQLNWPNIVRFDAGVAAHEDAVAHDADARNFPDPPIGSRSNGLFDVLNVIWKGLYGKFVARAEGDDYGSRKGNHYQRSESLSLKENDKYYQ
ncbi:hypothetical protein NQ318_008798 [Aromia moschata]|uniref:Uncharacterized protein n=1 Tax=Aromia moschata TaxID=1265417 RepID=A0AAV8ZBB0_9CUCU|nr:hypothetical protein NQ318_008798 [Aromia moschata]